MQIYRVRMHVSECAAAEQRGAQAAMILAISKGASWSNETDPTAWVSGHYVRGYSGSAFTCRRLDGIRDTDRLLPGACG